MHLSYLEPLEVADGFLLLSRSSSTVILGWWWQNLLDHSLGIPHSHLEARNCWWWWRFIFIGNGRRYFHFITISLFQAFMVFFFIFCSFFGVWGYLSVRENLHRNTGPLSYEVEYWLPVWITSDLKQAKGKRAQQQPWARVGSQVAKYHSWKIGGVQQVWMCGSLIQWV